MADAFSRHATALGQVQSYLGAANPVITFNGTDYKLGPGSAVRKKDLGRGGYSMNCDFSFVVLASLFATPPALKEKVTYLGDVYRVAAIHKLPGNLIYRYECNDENENV